MKMKWWFALGIGIHLPIVFGHGFVQWQIEELSQEIHREPPNAEHYLMRGRLYMDEEHYHQASDDFNEALNRDSHSRSAYYFLGEVAFKAGQYQDAKRYAERFIDALDGESGALTGGYRLLGSSFLQLGEYAQAAYVYQQAIDHADAPRPDYFLELATVYQQMHLSGDALMALEKGRNKLGFLAVFDERALEIEIADGSYGAALKRLDDMIAQGRRLPVLYQQKSKILLLAGRSEEGKQAKRKALAELDKLPDMRRNTPAMQSLRKDLMVNTR